MVTFTLPLVPVPTIAVIVLSFTTIKLVAEVTPKLIADAPVNFVPLIITVAPVLAAVGENEEIEGGGKNTKPVFVEDPPPVVTLTFPLVPVPTIAVIEVALTTVNDVAAVPPKLTDVTLVKFIPEMVMTVPLFAVVGVHEVIIGGAKKLNPDKLPVPPIVVTLTFPLVPALTIAVIILSFTTEKLVATVPPKLTTVVPKKYLPFTITVEPLGAVVGVKDVIIGKEFCVAMLTVVLLLPLLLVANIV